MEVQGGGTHPQPHGGVHGAGGDDSGRGGDGCDSNLEGMSVPVALRGRHELPG